MSDILEPNFNGLPKPTDWKKVIVPLQQANEKEFRGATLPELADEMLKDKTINGQRMKAVPPGALPAGPSDKEMYMVLESPGRWTFGGTNFDNVEGQIMTLWWNKTTYSVDNRAVLPLQQGVDIVTKGGSGLPKESAVYSAISKVWVDEFKDQPIISTEVLGNSTGTSLDFGNIAAPRVRYNSLCQFPFEGNLKEIIVNILTAGNIIFGVGRQDQPNVFSIREVVGTFNVVEGINNLNDLNFETNKGEIVAIIGGTARVSYSNSSSFLFGNRYIQTYSTSGANTAQSPLGQGISYSILIEYLKPNDLKSTLDKEYLQASQFNPDVFVSKVKNTLIPVSKIQGNNAIQLALDSISDASELNRYIIDVDSGIYKIGNSSEFLGNIVNDYPAMIATKDYVDIIGKSKSSTIVWAELPYADEDIDTEIIRSKHQTIWSWAHESRIKNITFIGTNLRYVLHQDNINEQNKKRYYENCDFIFLGDKGYTRALGIGSYSGSETYVIGGKSQSPARSSYSIHNNRAFQKPSLWKFESHVFENLSGTTGVLEIMLIFNSGSMQDCIIELNNCGWNQKRISYQEGWLYQGNINDCFNHANFRVIGSGNMPAFFDNNVVGSALMVKSKSTGLTSKVRFDKNSSAYNSIIANPYDYFGPLGHPERIIHDKYVVFDGKQGLSGYAIGGKSIFEGEYYNEVLSTDNLGVRLGNCSVLTKTLKINIDGSDYQVLFNKNYSTFTNAQIIAEINTVIGSVATASEYNIGADYMCEFTDVLSLYCNDSLTTPILKGTIVTQKNSRILPCSESDVPLGLLIDDIAPRSKDSNGVLLGIGRVIRNCYVTIENGNISSVLNSGIAARYKISSGQFMADGNGKYVLEDSKYILI